MTDPTPIYRTMHDEVRAKLQRLAAWNLLADAVLDNDDQFDAQLSGNGPLPDHRQLAGDVAILAAILIEANPEIGELIVLLRDAAREEACELLHLYELDAAIDGGGRRG